MLRRWIMNGLAENPGALRNSVEVPLVSILMLTYNHEKFIRQAVESVMMQKARFPYELVVGEDCSTDGTRAVLLELKDKYPDRIRLLLHEHNLGPHRNTEEVLRACRGRYIATLEGDDYWTSVTKLQEQVDVMEQHPDCAICCHAADVIYEGERKKGLPLRLPLKKPAPAVHFNEMLRRGNFLCAPTVMFRAQSVGRLPEWHRQVYTGDWALWLLAARNGKIHYLDKPMAVSRRHEGGRWSTADKIQELKYKSASVRIFLNNLDLTRHQQAILRRLKGQTDWRIAVLLLLEDDYDRARQRLRELLVDRPWVLLYPDILFLTISILTGRRIGRRIRMAAVAMNSRLGRFRFKCRRVEETGPGSTEEYSSHEQ